MRRTPLVLVVDDDSASANELTQWLVTRGYRAVAAGTCLEARAIAAAVPIDCMIGHLALADGSLFEVAQALRQNATAEGQRSALVIVWRRSQSAGTLSRWGFVTSR